MKLNCKQGINNKITVNYNFRSPSIYMAILGVMEIPAYTLTIPITKKIGRKNVISSGLIAAALLEIIIVSVILSGFNNGI